MSFQEGQTYVNRKGDAITVTDVTEYSTTISTHMHSGKCWNTVTSPSRLRAMLSDGSFTLNEPS